MRGHTRRADEAASAAPTRPVVDVPPGYRVGRWQVGERIGDGAWSTVYAGRPVEPGDASGPEVALKFVAGDRLSPQQRAHAREMASREMASLRRPDHPRLVRVYDAFELADPHAAELHGTVVIVMERAVGSLREMLNAATPGTPVPNAERMLVELCEALRELHAAGWVHGDVKPGNVLLMRDGSVRLADFGLAGELEGTHAYLPVLGSDDYLPPEWWTEQLSVRGVPTRPSRDMWAFGVIAHQLLSGGVYPFPGATARARSAAARAFADGRTELRLSDALPPAWQAIVRDCLAPDHERRAVHTADAMLHRMRDAGRGDHTRQRVRRAVSRPIYRLIGLGTAVALASGALLAWQSVGGDTAGTAQQPTTLGGELRPDADVPAEYRELIVNTAHGCAEPAVTPALIAAMLRVESNFDPAKRSPETDEYGIAMWTPSVFEQWQIDADGDGQASVFSAADSIVALGKFLCGVVDRNRHVPGDRALVLAAVYRVGGANVRAVNGIPPSAERYIEAVRHYLIEYSAP